MREYFLFFEKYNFVKKIFRGKENHIFSTNAKKEKKKGDKNMKKRTRQDPARDLIFGKPGSTINVADIARATGIPHTTLARYKARPELITLGRLRIILRERELTDSQIAQLIRGDN